MKQTIGFMCFVHSLTLCIKNKKKRLISVVSVSVFRENRSSVGACMILSFKMSEQGKIRKINKTEDQ